MVRMTDKIEPLVSIDASDLEKALKDMRVSEPKGFMRALVDSYLFSGGAGGCVELDDFREHFQNYLADNGLKSESNLTHLYIKALADMRVVSGDFRRVCLPEAWEDEIMYYLKQKPDSCCR